MHDIDRTQPLLRQGQAYEFEFETEANETQFESGGQEMESPLGEAETMELASELLEVQSEQELEQFLGDIVSKIGSAVRGAARTVGDFARTSTGQQLVGLLKGAAKTALPAVGTAVGGYFGGPVGAQIGSAAAGQLGQALGLELEGLSHEDQHFEVAQQFVKLAGAAAQTAAAMPPSVPAPQAAKAAFVEAAKSLAPGLIRPSGTNGIGTGGGIGRQTNGGGAGHLSLGSRRSGRWHRHGNSIVLMGA
jgi:hypothetical protein